MESSVHRYRSDHDPFSTGTYNPVQLLVGPGYAFRVKLDRDGRYIGAVTVQGRSIELSHAECRDFNDAPDEAARTAMLRQFMVADEARRAALAASKRAPR